MSTPITYIPWLIAHRAVASWDMICSKLAVEFGGGVRAQEPLGLVAVARDVAGGHLAEVVDTVDGDQGGEAVLERGRSGGEYAAHAAAEERDAAVVDLGELFDEVDEGVMTVSQSGRKTRPWWWRGPGCPGPSKVRTVYPRSTAASAPLKWSSSAVPSNPLCMIRAGRGVPESSAR